MSSTRNGMFAAWSFPLSLRNFVSAWPPSSEIPVPSQVGQRRPMTVTSALCVRSGTYRSSCSCRVPLLISHWRYFPRCPRCHTRVDWVWQEPERRGRTGPMGTRTQPSASPSALLRPARTVLLIDDRAETRTALRCVLERANYDVEAASNGTEGFAKLHAGARPGIIVLNLSDEAAGDFQRAHLRGPTAIAYIPVIVCSGVFGPQPAGGSEPPDSLSLEAVLALVSLFCPAIGQCQTAEAMGVSHERRTEVP